MLKIFILAAIAVAVASASRSQRFFAGNMFNSLRKVHPNENVLFSSHSVYNALRLVYNGDRGQTQLNLANNLFLIEHCAPDGNNVTPPHAESTGIQFNSLSKLYITKNDKLKSIIQNTLLRSPVGELEEVDFSNPEQLRAEINRFVQNSTQDSIGELLPSGSIQSNADALLISAASFKGIWQDHLSAGRNATFYGDTQISVEMMSSGQIVLNNGHILEGDVQFVELPYENNDISMFAFLPIIPYNRRKPIDVDQFLDKTSIGEAIDEAIKGGRSIDAFVSIPKMVVEGAYNLKDVLADMGINSLIDEVGLDDIYHKAVIDINNEGKVKERYYEPGRAYVCGGPDITLNRPFVYAIYNKSTKEILFAGIFRGPQ